MSEQTTPQTVDTDTPTPPTQKKASGWPKGKPRPKKPVLTEQAPGTTTLGQKSVEARIFNSPLANVPPSPPLTPPAAGESFTVLWTMLNESANVCQGWQTFSPDVTEEQVRRWCKNSLVPTAQAMNYVIIRGKHI